MKIESAQQVVERLAGAVVEDLPFNEGDEVLAFVNGGLGGTPLIELYIVYNELHKFLEGRGDHDRTQPHLGNRQHLLEIRLLDHAAAAGRRAQAAVGRAGQHAGPALGRLAA